MIQQGCRIRIGVCRIRKTKKKWAVAPSSDSCGGQNPWMAPVSLPPETALPGDRALLAPELLAEGPFSFCAAGRGGQRGSSQSSVGWSTSAGVSQVASWRAGPGKGCDRSVVLGVLWLRWFTRHPVDDDP